MPWLLALFLMLGLTTASSYVYAAESGIRTNESPVAQTIRSRIEAMPNIQTRALSIGGLTLPQAIAGFYASRDYTPAWDSETNVNQLFTSLENLRSDGLNPEDYQLSALHDLYIKLPSAKKNGQETIQERANFDVAATRSYLLSLAHLFRGKVNPTALDSNWNFTRNDLALNDAMKILNDGIAKQNITDVYQHTRPQHDLYLRARTALAQLNTIATQGGWPRMEAKTTLKPGVKDPQVILLRQRLLPEDSENAQNDIYDEALVTTVKEFQRKNYLTADGVIGQATYAALNISIQQRIDQVRVNLERGRWLFNEIHSDFVLVDVAGYKIYFFKNSQVVWQSQVQVGKPIRSTPIFKSQITHVTFNPTWTVPPTILRKDILPKVRKNIGYLKKNNIRVLDRQGRELDPNSVNWSSPGNIMLRQDASEDAALGQVAIRFPNPYAVYLHDTPHRLLFGPVQRAFSSGCIRVERPLELVELLYDDAEKWSLTGIENFIAKNKTRNINLPKPVPILLAYWTIDVLDNGELGFKPDIYQRDPALLKALNAKL
jgi:L,D-transpeptidase YcbB